jgi:hypothetical protein
VGLRYNKTAAYPLTRLSGIQRISRLVLRYLQAVAPGPAADDQKWWIDKRAQAQGLRDHADEDTTDLDEPLAVRDIRGTQRGGRPTREHHRRSQIKDHLSRSGL